VKSTRGFSSLFEDAPWLVALVFLSALAGGLYMIIKWR
jgi:hypothetical protein